jgi:hypothetical protein
MALTPTSSALPLPSLNALAPTMPASVKNDAYWAPVFGSSKRLKE